MSCRPRKRRFVSPPLAAPGFQSWKRTSEAVRQFARRVRERTGRSPRAPEGPGCSLRAPAGRQVGASAFPYHAWGHASKAVARHPSSVDMGRATIIVTATMYLTRRESLAAAGAIALGGCATAGGPPLR